MLWRSNKRKNQSDGKTENRITPAEEQHEQITERPMEDLKPEEFWQMTPKSDEENPTEQLEEPITSEVVMSELSNEEKAEWIM